MNVPQRWRLVPQFLLRRAGFSFDELEALATPGLMDAAARLVEVLDVGDSLRRRQLSELFPAAVRQAAAQKNRRALRDLSRWRRWVGHQSTRAAPAGDFAPELRAVHTTWVEARAEAQALRQRLSEELAAESLRSRRTLRAFFKRPDAREALFLLSPDLIDGSQAALDAAPSLAPDSGERALERRLYAYLQRLASKNETTSFFGPLAYGSVTDQVADGVSFGPETPRGFVRREAFLAFWAAAQIGKSAAADPELRRHLPLRRVPVARLQGSRAWAPNNQEVPMTPELLAVLEHVDGRNTSASLAEHLGIAPAECEKQVVKLERSALVRRELEPKSTDAYPLEDVRRQLPSVASAEKWRVLCDALFALLRRFEAAELAERRTILDEAEKTFAAATGVPARRSGGQMYADRTILYEDCLGDLQPVRMSSHEARQIEAALGPTMELGARYGQLRHAAFKELARRTIAEAPAPLPFLAFAELIEKRIEAGELEPLMAPVKEWLQRYTALVSANVGEDGHRVRLSPEQLRDLTEGAKVGRFASPDVMIVEGGGETPRYVLGEVHPYVFAWGSQNHFAPDPQALQGAFHAQLDAWGGLPTLATVLRRRRHKGLVSHAFPGKFIEVTGRSVDDAARRLAVGDLEVVLHEGAPQLRGPTGALVLYTGEDDHPHLRAFSIPAVQIPPVRLGAHTPRIEIGALLVQRERWQLGADDAAAIGAANDALALAQAVVRGRNRHGWPRFVFASSPSEPKPICLDLEAGFAHGLLQRLVNSGAVALSEMAPAPGQLWLHRQQRPYTSELRMALVRDE